MTPRERVQRYADAATDPRAKAPYIARCLDGEGKIAELDPRDLRAVLAANAGYERIIAEQRREAVAEYKRELAAALRERAVGVFDADAHSEVISVAECLEDDSL